MSSKYYCYGLPSRLGGTSTLVKKKIRWLVYGLLSASIFLLLSSYVTTIPMLGALNKWNADRKANISRYLIFSPAWAPPNNQVFLTATAGLVGTWTGTIACDDGESTTFDFIVSSNGHPVYFYQNQEGNNRKVELTHEGQTIKFIPAEGGVTQVQVAALSRSANNIGYSLDITSERLEGSTIIQEQIGYAVNGVLSGTALVVELAVSFQSVMSQPGYVVPGEPRKAFCSGKLRKK